MGKNISENLSHNHRQKLIDRIKQSATDAIKTVSKIAIHEVGEATGDMLFGNKIADKITEISRTSPHNKLETVKNKYDKEIPKERYISPEERQKIIDYLRLI